MARKYELVRHADVDDARGDLRQIPDDLLEIFEHANHYEHITAIDQRDVEPLLVVAREIAKLGGGERGLSSAFSLTYVKSTQLHALTDALKPFEDQEEGS
jgi:hypothetical protein